MKVLSDRVASEWMRGTNNYTSQELMILGRLLCGMNSSSILQIPSTSVGNTIKYESSLDNVSFLFPYATSTWKPPPTSG